MGSRDRIDAASIDIMIWRVLEINMYSIDNERLPGNRGLPKQRQPPLALIGKEGNRIGGVAERRGIKCASGNLPLPSLVRLSVNML